MRWARGRVAMPLLDTPDFHKVFGGADGSSLPLDQQRLLRELSAIAFPGTLFELREQCSPYIFRAWSSDHRLERLFVDIRFLEEVDGTHPQRCKQLPSRAAMLEELFSLLGTSYVWGGNWHTGIPEMLLYYPPQQPFATLDPLIQKTWLMQGVDCSGLLYQVSQGITPRSTFIMTDFGCAVPLAQRSDLEIAAALEPLDLLITYGHVAICFDSHHVIESRAGRGVILTPLEEYFGTILKDKQRLDCWSEAQFEKTGFIVRRWIDNF